MSASKNTAISAEDVDSGSDNEDIDIREDSEGWNDVDDDLEELQIKCLLCTARLPTLAPLLEHQKVEHDFDLAAIKQKYDLDFYGLIKLVNYVRSSIASTQKTPNIDDPLLWDDDRFLQPVLEDDALITCLDDLEDLAIDSEIDGVDRRTKASNSLEIERIRFLEEKLANLSAHFDAYRQEVAETLDRRWRLANESDQHSSSSSLLPSRTQALAEHHAELDKKYEDGYFNSYATLGIHQTMLQDSVRTDAYRDFIYDNKHIFEHKTVLDVGCGTGILSLLAAKAGAKHVVAVDASKFIDNARGIAVVNGLSKDVGGPIVFHKGKVEDITNEDALRLGLVERTSNGSIAGRVDILISEWMGYCLLFEAMLPSVLHARDRFLRREPEDENTFAGLMVPSHASIHIAPLSDPDWMTDNVSFWHDVYGFDMSSLLSGAIEEVQVRMPPKEAVIISAKDRSNSSTEVKVFDLYATTVAGLDFTSSYQSTACVDGQSNLDGFCIWFDICFSPKSPSELGQSKAQPDVSSLKKDPGAVSFSTSPFGKSTHWQTGCCTIDWTKQDRCPNKPVMLENADVLDCRLAIKRGEEGRDLEVTVEWKRIGKDDSSNKQMWKMR